MLVPFNLIGSNGDNLFSSIGLHSLGDSDLLAAGINPDCTVYGDNPGICLPVSGLFEDFTKKMNITSGKAILFLSTNNSVHVSNVLCVWSSFLSLFMVDNTLPSPSTASRSLF